MQWVRAVRAAARRHPRAVDAGLAGLLALVSVPSTAVAGATGPDWLWFAAFHLPLVWRRRAPAAVFWVALASLGISDMLGVPAPAQIIVALVAVHAVARYRPVRHVVPAAAAFALVITLYWLESDPLWPPSAPVTAMYSILAATVLLGMAARTRRAYLEELRERARRLERERDQQARLAVAAERARIAREMHDIVAHNLAVMVALADGAAFAARTAPEQAADAMRQVSDTGREALAETRRLLGLLRDGEPAQPGPGPDGQPSRPRFGQEAERVPQPGLADIDELVDQIRAAGVRVELTREGRPGEWGAGAGLAVYRIVQEALTNTLKHAGPRASAQVRLQYTPDEAELRITDDGARQPARAPAGDPDADGSPGTSGHGLAGMAERAASYGGHVDAGPRPGGGWQVHARLRFDDTEGAA